MAKLQIRVLSYPHFQPIETEYAIFDPDLTTDQADGALCYYLPDLRLLEVNHKPRAWLYAEPSWHSMYRTTAGRRLVKALRADERLWYGNPDPRYRVKHPTHFDELKMEQDGDHVGTVALVSNFGGKFWIFRPSFRLRNKFVTHPLVALYGKSAAWSSWRTWGVVGKRGYPSNYRGDVQGHGWALAHNIRFLTNFHAVVCLENSIEPWYFTEKLVNAVCAGCVPIYHADKTVAQTILQGARWIDPKDYAFDPDATIRAALAADRQAFNRVNRCWLKKPELAATQEHAVWEQVGRIFAFKCGRLTSL